jgi:hypothetical protein
VESAPAVPRSLAKAQSEEIPTLSEWSTVPPAYCSTWGDNHRHREAESRMRMTDPKE